MTAIVVGGAGFIGSHLVDALEDDTLVIDPRTVRGLPHSAQDTFYGELPESGVDAIYHLGSPVGPVTLMQWAGRLAYEIITAAEAVASWAKRYNCPLVFISTSEIYGPHDAPVDEDADRIIRGAHSARMEYPVAKLAAEVTLLNTEGLDVRIIRPFNVAGPRQREEGGFVLPRFIRMAKAGEPLTVYGDGSMRRAFTHVADIVEGILLAATQGYAGGVWNLGNPANECTIAQLAADVIAITGSTSAIEYVDPQNLWGPAFREAADKVPNIEKAQRELGWQPTRDRLQVIRDAAG